MNHRHANCVSIFRVPTYLQNSDSKYITVFGADNVEHSVVMVRGEVSGAGPAFLGRAGPLLQNDAWRASNCSLNTIIARCSV